MATYPTEEKVTFQFPAGLRVLAVDDDLTILEVIKKMCCRCHYRVTTFSDALLALNYLREKKDCIDVILTEVHMTNMDGYEFLKHVTREINVPVVMMSHDDATNSVMEAVTHGACAYWIKPFNENQIRIMWKHVARKVWNEKKLPKKDYSELASSVHGITKMNPKKNSSYEPDDCDAPPTKKPRLVWQGELQQQFVKAVMHVGLDKAQPKRILEVMNIPGLTKQHVASHLQKYRLNLKNSNEMIVQENEMQLSNSIESRGRVGAYSLVPYVVLHPEEQWPNHYHLEQGVPYIAKCHSNMVNNANNFAQSIMTVDDAPIYGVLPSSNTVTANNIVGKNNASAYVCSTIKAADSDALSNSFNPLSAIVHGSYNFKP